MPFINGQQLELNVIERKFDSAGYPYILLENPYPIEYPNLEVRVYNILLCQEEELPNMIYIKVKIDQFSRFKFIQDVGRVLQEHYQKNKFYAFSVKSIETDNNTRVPYYVLADEIHYHRFYFNGEQKHKVGDDIVLEVTGFTEDGFLRFEEHETPQTTETVIRLIDETVQVDSTSPFANVAENEKVEFKTSIVFEPGNNTANIDKQIENILRALTAFMNTEGGTLYIGVHDKTKRVVGIQGDFDDNNLNSSRSDDFVYEATTDHYELKIRHSIVKLCSTYADSLLHFGFDQVDGRTYCRIDVDKAEKPIYVKGNRLYVRHGNHINQLLGEELSYYIVKKLAGSISRENNTISAEELLEKLKGYLSMITPRIPEGVVLPAVRDLGEIDHWIVFYNDGRGIWQRNRSTNEANVLFQVPIYRSINQPKLILCYGNGRINVLDYATYKRGKRIGSIFDVTWNKGNGTPNRIFVAEPTDYIVGKSVDAHGLCYIKLHSVSDYKITGSTQNQGAPFLPDCNSIVDFNIIGPEHRNKVQHIIVPKRERANNPGTPISTANQDLAREIAYIEALLDRQREN